MDPFIFLEGIGAAKINDSQASLKINGSELLFQRNGAELVDLYIDKKLLAEGLPTHRILSFLYSLGYNLVGKALQEKAK